MKIRLATVNDHDAIWEIFKHVISTKEVFVFLPDTPKEDIYTYWLSSTMHTYVLENEGKILGSYYLKPNQVGYGSHIANGGYMTHPAARGKGIGKLLCEHSITNAKALGFKAIQFNMVVSTNSIAVDLWKKYGFKIIGTIPEAFNHHQLGYVDAYIMYQKIA